MTVSDPDVVQFRRGVGEHSVAGLFGTRPDARCAAVGEALGVVLYPVQALVIDLVQQRRHLRIGGTGGLHQQHDRAPPEA